jgi:predicted RNA-binding Zn-ribbon protein involved in translation (DUF1610 family)
MIMDLLLARKRKNLLRQVLRASGRCICCGYQLSVREEYRCPECGAITMATR